VVLTLVEDVVEVILVEVALEVDEDEAINPNHARSSSVRTGTECPTSRAEKPISFVPSP
jgi:hypothetical protein